MNRLATLVVVVVAVSVGSVACQTTAPTPEPQLAERTAPQSPQRTQSPPRQRALSTEAARAALQAELHLQQGDATAAAAAWRSAVRADDTSPYLQLRLGEALLLVGDAQGADGAATAAIALCHDGKDDSDETEQHIAALRLRAQTRAELGDDDGSEATLREVLERKPGDSDASGMLAERLVKRGALDLAEDVVVQWMQHSTSVAGAVALGLVFAERGQHDRGMIHLERALEKDPKSARALDAKLRLLWALGRYPEAADTAHAALKAIGDTMETRSTLITAVGLASPPATIPLVRAMLGDGASEREKLVTADALERAGLVDAAAAVLAPAKASDRVSGLVLLEIARLSLTQRQPERALNVACSVADGFSKNDGKNDGSAPNERALDHAVMLCASAELEAKGGDASRGLVRVMNTITSEPRPRPLHTLARVVEHLGRSGAHEAAIQVALHKARAHTAHSDVDVALAALSVLTAAREYDEAIAGYEALLAKAPTDPRIVLAHARAKERHADNDAQALAAIELAERLLERAQAAGKHNVEAMNFIAFSLAERGLKSDRAKELAWQAVLREPTSGYILDTLGWAQLKGGEACVAAKTLRRADKLSPNEGELWFHIAAAEQACGNSNDARSAAKRALQLLPAGDPLRERTQRVLSALDSI